MSRWTTLKLGDEEAVGYLIVKDQDGNEVDDDDIIDAARRVYSASCEMMRAAYIVTAYSGLGKVKGKDLVVYPTDPIDIRNGYLRCPTFEMNIRVEKL